MADLWDELLNPSKIGDIEVPISRRKLRAARSGARHRFVYRNGQIIEDTGGDPLAFEIEVPLFASIDETHYPGVYDQLMRTLRESDMETTFEDPVFGTIAVKVWEISGEENSEERDGVRLVMTMEERITETDAAFPFTSYYEPRSQARESAEELDALIEQAGITSEDVYGALEDADVPLTPYELDAIGDTTDIFSSLTSTFIEGFEGVQIAAWDAVERVDAFRARIDSIRRLPQVQFATNWGLIRATAQLMGSITRVAEEQAAQRTSVVAMPTSREASIWELAASLSISPEKVNELLRMNSIPEPLFIPAGTILRYVVE